MGAAGAAVHVERQDVREALKAKSRRSLIDAMGWAEQVGFTPAQAPMAAGVIQRRKARDRPGTTRGQVADELRARWPELYPEGFRFPFEEGES